jgi:hypothetical protein
MSQLTATTAVTILFMYMIAASSIWSQSVYLASCLRKKSKTGASLVSQSYRGYCKCEKKFKKMIVFLVFFSALLSRPHSRIIYVIFVVMQR